MFDLQVEFAAYLELSESKSYCFCRNEYAGEEYSSREQDVRELIPHTSPSSYDNYLKSIFRCVTYSVSIYTLTADWSDLCQTSTWQIVAHLWYPKLDLAVMQALI